MNLRQLRRTDHDQVFEFQRALYGEGYVFWGSNIRRSSDKWVDRNLEASEMGTAVVSVAEVNGRIAGIATINSLFSPFGSGRDIGSLIIAVAKGVRGKGVGSSLMGDVLEKGRESFAKVVLSVSQANKGKKLRFYRRFGFRVCRSADNQAEGEKSNMVEMALEIAGNDAVRKTYPLM